MNSRLNIDKRNLSKRMKLLIPLLMLLCFFIGNVTLPLFISNPLEVKAAITKKNAKDEVPKEYIPIYQAAAKKYGIPWTFLANIHNQETGFSTINKTSSAGAIGHTQFLKCTWTGYSLKGCATALPLVYTNVKVIKQHGGLGVDGNQDGKADPDDLVDAIYSTANYMHTYYAKGGASEAASHYNPNQGYINEVTARDARYIKAFKDSSPKGTMNSDGKVKKGNWLKGVSSNKAGKLTGDISSSDDSSSSSESTGAGSTVEDKSPFNEYKLHLSNVGVKNKSSFDAVTTRYQANKYLVIVSRYLMTGSRILGALLFGYMSFLWLFVLLARTKFPPAYAFVLKMTNGLIDPFDDLNKLFKYSIYGFIFSVIAVSGLIPKVFAFIYYLIHYLIDFVMYNL